MPTMSRPVETTFVSKSCFGLPEFLRLWSISVTLPGPSVESHNASQQLCLHSPSPGLLLLPKAQREAPGVRAPTLRPSPWRRTQVPGHKETTFSPETEKKKKVLINTKISNNDSAQLRGSRSEVEGPLVLSEDKLKIPISQ